MGKDIFIFVYFTFQAWSISGNWSADSGNKRTFLFEFGLDRYHFILSTARKWILLVSCLLPWDQDWCAANACSSISLFNIRFHGKEIMWIQGQDHKSLHYHLAGNDNKDIIKNREECFLLLITDFYNLDAIATSAYFQNLLSLYEFYFMCSWVQI